MSYARIGWEGSDVYVFLSGRGYFDCCGCSLSSGWSSYPNTDAILAHLREHRDAGHCVVEDTLREIENDRAANDAWLATEAAKPLTPKSPGCVAGRERQT